MSALPPGAQDDGLALTAEILSEPGALEEIRAALAELDRGEGVEGIEAISALAQSRLEKSGSEEERS